MMDSQFRYVIDANILIDADKGGILHEMFKLPCIFVTTDLVGNELLNPPVDVLLEKGLQLYELDGSFTTRIVEIRADHHELSIKDISVHLLADFLKLCLLTGDESLRDFTESKGIEVHGTLWMIDQLVERQIISQSEAKRALTQMLSFGRRLPKKECLIRLEQWKS